MSQRVTCPCCGHRTLPSGPGDYEVCGVCGWDDDGVSTRQPTVWFGGPNATSLAEAQRRLRLYGPVRTATSDEPLDPDWTPYSSSELDDPRLAYLRDLGWLLCARAVAARDQARRSREAHDRGRFEGLTEAVDLLMSQAAIFDFPLDDLGLSEADREELVFDPPSGRVTG